MGNLQFHKSLSGAGRLCASEEETQAAAAQLAQELIAPTAISLEGPMGAGKTCFVKGLAKGLGCNPDDVSSPTFAIVHEYHGGLLPLVHMDLYRLKSPEELVGIGWDDYLHEPVIAAIEWGGNFLNALPAGTLRLAFSIEGHSRRIRLIE